MPKLTKNRIVEYRDTDNTDSVPAMVVGVNEDGSADLVVFGARKPRHEETSDHPGGTNLERFAVCTRYDVKMGTGGPLEGPEWSWPEIVK